MTAFGFKPVRFAQWLRIIKMEARTLTLKDALLAMWKMICHRGGAARRTWFIRMRTCHRCPIHDNELKRCRPFTGSPFGCGCYTPFLATGQTGSLCYATRHFPEKKWGWTP
jgi:hypothetical protein